MSSFKRKELLQKLETVAPAVAAHDLSPILKHILFTGTQIIAYDTKIAIATALKSDFKGTVPGKVLIDTLRIISHADKVELSRSNGAVTIGGGRTRIKLESHSIEDFVFRMPVAAKNTAMIDEDFLDAIDTLLQSTVETSSEVQYTGITWIPATAKAKLFSYNNKNSMSYRQLDVPPPLRLKQRVILPALFCGEMLRLGKHAVKNRLALTQDYAMFFADDTVLSSQHLTLPEQPTDFEKVLARMLPNKPPIKLSKQQRPRLKIALELAARLCNIEGNEVQTYVACRNNAMEFRSSSQRGEAIDKINIEHPDISVKLKASFLHKVYDRYEDLLITDRCAILSCGPDDIYLLSCGS
jgi:hypothetical protein